MWSYFPVTSHKWRLGRDCSCWMVLDLKLAQALAKQLRGNYFLTSFFFHVFLSTARWGICPRMPWWSLCASCWHSNYFSKWNVHTEWWQWLEFFKKKNSFIHVCNWFCIILRCWGIFFQPGKATHSWQVDLKSPLCAGANQAKSKTSLQGTCMPRKLLFQMTSPAQDVSTHFWDVLASLFLCTMTGSGDTLSVVK